jgi:hypothetical protein
MGTVLLFRDDSRAPRAEVALGDSDRIGLSIDGGGLTIRRLGGDNRILFQAGADLVGHICAALVEPPNTLDATPLQIVVAVVLQLSSAADVERVFRDAAAQVS